MFTHFKELFSSKLILAGILPVVLACCKKQSDVWESKTDIITSGSWRETGSIVYTITGTIDNYSNYPACKKDDYLKFNKDGTLEFSEGLTKCDSSDPQVQIGKWKFLENANKIEINSDDYLISNLDDYNFQLSTPRSDPYAAQSVFSYAR